MWPFSTAKPVVAEDLPVVRVLLKFTTGDELEVEYTECYYHDGGRAYYLHGEWVLSVADARLLYMRRN